MIALVAIMLLLLVVGVLTFSPRSALLCIIIGTLFLTQEHAVNIVGAAFFPNRLLTYLAFLRVLWRGEFDRTRMTAMDWSLIILYAFTTLVLLTRPEESAPMRLARMFDVTMGYVAFRGLISSPDDLRWLLRRVSVLLVPYVLLLAYEMVSQQHLFFSDGEVVKQFMREGRFRCFGSFRHPSLLGSVGASFFPLFVALAWDQKHRRLGVLGAGLSLAVIVLSNSGGPLSAWIAGVIAWLLWPLRTRMRVVRWMLLLAVLGLAMVMKAPLWYLLMHVSSVTGGTGWHRAYLIDVAIRHIGQWWFMGMPVVDTQGWFPYDLKSTGGADITNQYISFGLNSGVAGILLFIAFVICSYSHVGRALSKVRTMTCISVAEERLLWSLGAVLTVHVFNWLGITYFDQFITIWVLQMAALCSLSQYWLSAVPKIQPSATPLASSPPETRALA